jgi:hypothetical protein
MVKVPRRYLLRKCAVGTRTLVERRCQRVELR